MAYCILNPNESNKLNIHRIAENEEEKNLFHTTENFIVVDLSDEDFNKIKINTHFISGYSEENGYQLQAQETNDLGIFNKESLQNHLNFLSSSIANYLNNNNQESSIRSFWETYKGVIDGFDVESLTYPTNFSWEKYCQDNGIPFKSILQLP